MVTNPQSACQIWPTFVPAVAAVILLAIVCHSHPTLCSPTVTAAATAPSSSTTSSASFSVVSSEPAESHLQNESSFVPVPPLRPPPIDHNRSTHEEMYKAITILQELFFPQWIQLLKDENVIEPPDLPPSTTATATTSRSRFEPTPSTDSSSELFFYNISQQFSGEEDTATTTTLFSPPNGTSPLFPLNNHTAFRSSDEMFAATADTVAQLLRNITYLPVLTFPYQLHDAAALLANNTTLACPAGNCTAVPPAEETNYWALFLLVFPVLTIFGNALVILSVFRERSLQTATNYFIVSLACADLFVAAGVMPFAVYAVVGNDHWGLGDSLCDAWMACDVIASTCSIFNLTAISIDRFIAVTRPIKYARHKNHRRVVYTICIVWLVSCGIGMPIILGLNQPLNGVVRLPNECAFYNSDFIIYSSLSSFYIPCLLMIILYWHIFKAIRERAKKAASKKAHHHTGHHPAPASVTPTTKDHSGAIPLVDTRWNGAQDSLNKHRLSVAGLSNSNKGQSTAEGATNASSSFLVEGDEIEDIDQDSGAPNDGVNTPSENGPKDQHLQLPVARRDSLVSPDDEILSPDVDVEDLTSKTSSFRKTANLLSSALSPSSRAQNNSKPGGVLLENGGGANLLGPFHGKGGPFRSKNQLRRSMKTREKLLAKRERKATKTLAIVLGVFLVCWVPFFTANLITAICDKLNVAKPSATVFMVTTWLGYGNSFMNPVIYTVFNEEFRKAFLAILRCQSKFNS